MQPAMVDINSYLTNRVLVRPPDEPRRSAHHEESVTLPNLAREDRHHLPALEVLPQYTPRSHRKRFKGMNLPWVIALHYPSARQAFLQDQVQGGLRKRGKV